MNWIEALADLRPRLKPAAELSASGAEREVAPFCSPADQLAGVGRTLGSNA